MLNVPELTSGLTLFSTHFQRQKHQEYRQLSQTRVQFRQRPLPSFQRVGLLCPLWFLEMRQMVFLGKMFRKD